MLQLTIIRFKKLVRSHPKEFGNVNLSDAITQIQLQAVNRFEVSSFNFRGSAVFVIQLHLHNPLEMS
jgi:hypothetical protein